MRKALVVLLTLLVATAGWHAGAAAQDYPTKPVRIIVPSSAGGGSDIVARLLGEKLRVGLGTTVVIENRPGGGGRIGTEYVARAAPDGYTLLLVDLSHVVGPALHKVAYDPIGDFTPITELTRQAYVLVIPAILPVHSIQEFVALAKSGTRKMTYASSGIGAAAHLTMEEFKAVAHFDAAHVPYEGTSPAMNAILAKTVDGFFSSTPAAVPFLENGQLRAIAVTSLARSPALPDVPTIAESGYPGFEVEGWKGMLAPAKTPAAIVARLHDELAKALMAPDIKTFMAKDGSEPVGTTPAAFADYLKSERTKWVTLLKQAGIQPD